MKYRSLCLATVFLASVASFAQQNCAYTFTWTKSPSFSFCVTNYGTIGMIQAPLGTNHLDATKPVEGFAWFIADAQGGQAQGTQIPGLGQTDAGVATFSQPKGPGTLPLIANLLGFQETITADPKNRTITITFKVTDCGFDCEWEGFFSRAANTALDGQSVNSFASSDYAGFGFLKHGLMLSMPDFSAKGAFVGCGGIDPAGASTSVYETCGGSSFTGGGAIYADAFFTTMHTHHATLTYTYRVF